MLIVLRGNSGSGKSTLAAALQQRLGWPTAILGQDHFRRIVYKERERDGEKPNGMAHAGLLEAAARHCLLGHQHVILEGIFNANRYGPMIQRIAGMTSDARFYAFDLTFEQTLARHALRPQASEFTPEQMREWFHGWNALPFVEELSIGPNDTLDATVERVLDNA